MQKIITPEEADSLGPEEAVRLIFSSGFSISEEVTDISGRGVGMDVVRTSIEALNGTVEVKSEPGEGSQVYSQVTADSGNYQNIDGESWKGNLCYSY